jgi:hypothetical protein
MTSSKWVTSGFFRVHLWVLLGIQTLVAAVLYSAEPVTLSSPGIDQSRVLSIVAAVAAYVGSVLWLYERHLAGKAALVVVALCSLMAIAGNSDPQITPMMLAHEVTSGLLLGLVTTAMLLGHWYLNTPTMRLEPLKRLLVFTGVVTLVHMFVCGAGLFFVAHHSASFHMSLQLLVIFLFLRWAAGLAGVALMAFLAWQTLKIPNTQSATGILYAAVILAFIGELSSQFLSAQTGYPV